MQNRIQQLCPSSARLKNPFTYDVPPASQEELMAMVHPFEKQTKNNNYKKGKQSDDVYAKWAKFKRSNNIYVWVFLATCGVVATMWIESLDLTIRFGIFKGRDALLARYAGNYFGQYLAYIFFTMGLALLSSLLVKLACYPYAMGSGVPELKSILSGFFNKDAVSFKVLIVKSLALILAYGSGLSVGKEGPYVHLAACVANALLCFRPFNTEVAGNETKRSMMLGACSALGIAATFGSPIGGVLFSIEVTSTYYLIYNYWRAFFTCAVGAVAIKITLSQQGIHLLEDFRTDLPEISNLFSAKLVGFILVGIFCGALSSLFIYLYQKVVALKRRHATILAKITPYGEVLIVALLTAIISFPLNYLRLDHASAVHSLFTNTDIEVWYNQMFPNKVFSEENTAGSIRGAIILATLLYVFVKMALTIVSITLPIPYGIYIPLFAIGAAFGRAFGELFHLIFPHEGVLPSGFAAIGAAALCGGATRTISSAVIILELTNDMNYFVPILLAVTISTGIGNVLNHSIYDEFLRNKGLPYLPFLRVKGDSVVAHDIMNRDLCFITKKMKLEDIKEVLSHHKDYMIPIVETSDKMHLVGVIARKTLKRVVTYHDKLNLAAIGSLNGTAEIEMIEMEKENAQLLEEMEKSPESYVPSPVGPGLLPPNSPSSSSSSSVIASPPTLSASSSIIITSNDENNNNHDKDNAAIIPPLPSSPSLSSSPDEPIDLIDLSLRNPWVVIDTSPFLIAENTPIRKILFMFSMMGGHLLFVTYRGKLVGSITKHSLVLRLSPPRPQ